MKDNKTKPPIGTANTGHEYQVEIKPPFGQALVTELKKIGDRNKAKKKSEQNAAKDLNSSGNFAI